MNVDDLIRTAGSAIDAAGVAIVVLGVIVSTVLFLSHLRGGGDTAEAYPLYRRWLARAILLGLEFLVAGDIVRSVAVSPSFSSVGILAIIVLIRTFLSTELELEIDGRWPWQRQKSQTSAAREASEGQ